MQSLIDLIRKYFFSVPLFEEELKASILLRHDFCKDEVGEVENEFVRYYQSSEMALNELYGLADDHEKPSWYLRYVLQAFDLIFALVADQDALI